MSIANNFPDLDISPIKSTNEEYSSTPGELRSRLSSQENYDEKDSALSSIAVNNERTRNIPIPEHESSFVLEGTSIVVAAGCCDTARDEIRNCLSELGANVVDVVANTTTHLLVDEFADELLIQNALSRSPQPPNIVGIQWLEHCIQRQSHVPEHDFSLLDLSLDFPDENKENAPRRSSNIRTSLTNVSTSNLPELLKHIRKIAKDLGALETDFRGWGKWDHRPSECPKKQKKNRKFVAKMDKIFERNATKYPILRRRSHNGFIIQHRDKADPSIAVVEENKDTREVLEARRKPRKEVLNPPMRINAKNDMRKTTVSDLNTIRATMKRNARIGKTREKKKNKNINEPSVVQLSKDEDLSRAFSSLSLRSTQPIIMKPQTTSIVLNNILCENSVEDFLPTTTKVAFSGFESGRLKKLKAMAEDLDLVPVMEIDQDLKCIVSQSGQRTLAVLQGIVNRVPIVKPRWIEKSTKGGIQPTEKYEYEQWAEVLEKRRNNPNVLKCLGEVFVAEECDPPAAQLIKLIRISGGKITKKRERCDVLVTPENTTSTRAIVVPPRFIIDCITNNEIPDVDEYCNN